MKQIIRSLPDQIREAVALSPRRKKRSQRFERVLVCGMGGSGISAEILRALYPELNIIPNKNYSIPEYIDKHSLALVVSYSGNTEETLSNHRLLEKRKAQIVTISSDGKLLRKENDMKIRIPGGLPPRGALGYLFTPLPFILYAYHMIHTNPKPHLLALASFLTQQRKKVETKARMISRKIVNRLPLIYANSETFLPVARRWQCQFNENAKMLAHVNVFSEMNHNEIVGLGRPQSLNKKVVVIFLNEPQAHKRNRARVTIVKKMIKNMFSDIIDIQPLGTNALNRMFWTIWLGDFVSYYCAARSNIDPMPVERIDYLKKRLSQLK